MVLQEQEQRGPEAALGETSCAAMAVHAAIGKQPRRRFAFIDVLGLRWATAARIQDAEDEQTTAQRCQEL